MRHVYHFYCKLKVITHFFHVQVVKLCGTSKQRVTRSVRNGVDVYAGKKIFKANADNEETLSGKRRYMESRLFVLLLFHVSSPKLYDICNSSAFQLHR